MTVLLDVVGEFAVPNGNYTIIQLNCFWYNSPSKVYKCTLHLKKEHWWQ